MSAFRIMWLMVMFDLPTQSKKDRKLYRWFTRYIDAQGYVRLQYSVYAKVFNSLESANHGKKRLRNFLERNIKRGNVRMILFTDAQFARMEIVIGEQSLQEEVTQKSLFDF